MCTFISLLKQYFLLLITFCTYFERCSNFEFEAIYIFYVIVYQCKWVSGVDTYKAEIAADSIIWELFARKSAECLNLRNSFITISSHPTWIQQKSNKRKLLNGQSDFSLFSQKKSLAVGKFLYNLKLIMRHFLRTHLIWQVFIELETNSIFSQKKETVWKETETG